MPSKQRLDCRLVDLGLAGTRHQAQQWIRAGRVHHPGGTCLDKPGLMVKQDFIPTVVQPPRFVSRGGEKLEAALALFPIRVEGRCCLDGGISTGGFTDCLLQRGAQIVYGIDVGYGQTAWSLRCDPRVRLKERTNLRHLSSEELYEPHAEWPDLAVADVSFISLVKVLPALRRLTRFEGSEVVLLVKPQFEVGRSRVSRGGVVRSHADQLSALRQVADAAAQQGWIPVDVVGSPIWGPAGNQEYLLWLAVPPIARTLRRDRLSEGAMEEAVRKALET